MSNKKIIFVVCAIVVVLLAVYSPIADFPVHWLFAPFGVAMVIALPLSIIYGLVRFIKR